MIRKELLKARGKRSQEVISKKVGISQKHLSAIETGKRNPSIKTMQKLESYYKIPMANLFPDIFLNLKTTICSRKSNDQIKEAG